jgi:hypothetical protein
MNSEFNEKIASVLKIISEIKSANILISKELEKITLQLQELNPNDQNIPTAKKKVNPTIKKVSEQDDLEIEQPKYNIQVIGLGTVKIE